MGNTFSGGNIEGGCPVGVLLPLLTGFDARAPEACEAPSRCVGALLLPPPREPRPPRCCPLNAV